MMRLVWAENLRVVDPVEGALVQELVVHEQLLAVLQAKVNGRLA